MIKKRLRDLRKEMQEAGVDILLIPSADHHNSEYVSDYFRAREYYSGFTGSAGTLAVGRRWAALFTDGRYFLQAQAELEGSGICLMKMGEPGVPGLSAFLEKKLKPGQTLGFDGRTVSADEGKRYEEIAGRRKAKLLWDQDIAGRAWKERPALGFTRAYVLEEAYSGESCRDKIKRVRAEMKKAGASVYVLTALDDIAWLFNLRAGDIAYCPLLLSYAILTARKAWLFTGRAPSEEVKQYLANNGVTWEAYDDFYRRSAVIGRNKRVLADEKRINYRLLRELSGAKLIHRMNPTARMKAVKNRTEQENTRKAHLYDAVAMTEFMYYLKKNAGKEKMDEISLADKLESLRRRNTSFIELSFPTICAYRENGAIIHYEAVPDRCLEVKAEGMLMVDSGAHYLEGTTDITRTYILGEITPVMRKHYTMVVKAWLHLMHVRFLQGCSGINLDLAARGILWQEGLDYKHGTGHGVGHVLNVHEGPNSFRCRAAGSGDTWVFEEGMITTDEPGIYQEGSHGIRIENELLCKRGVCNEYGQFLEFENLTYVPIDRDGLDLALLERQELEWLNEYHQAVYEKTAPFFTGEKLDWLREICSEIA